MSFLPASTLRALACVAVILASPDEGWFARAQSPDDPSTRFWASTDLLVWWRKGMDLPVLVTNNDPVPRVLFGGEVGNGLAGGGRLNLGRWLTEDQDIGLGARFYAVGEETVNFDSRNTGEAVVVRPFVQAGVPMVLVVNNPPAVVGGVTAQTTSDALGADVFVRCPIRRDGDGRLDFLAGYQMSRIDEALTIRHVFTSGGVDFDGTDRFFTKNEFHGAGLGLLAQYDGPRCSAELLARLGLGNMHETVFVSGSDVSGAGTSASLLARESNAGIRDDNDFAAVREVGINVGYRVSRTIELTAGYTLIYWKHVAQPGRQIDVNLPNPQPLLNDSSFFLHGLNFGMTSRY